MIGHPQRRSEMFRSSVTTQMQRKHWAYILMSGVWKVNTVREQTKKKCKIFLLSHFGYYDVEVLCVVEERSQKNKQTKF